MRKLFENFDVWYDDSLEDDAPFMFAVRDRTNSTADETWALASVTKEEAEKVYNFLKEHLD